MKKIAIVISSALIILSACSKNNDSKYIEEINDYFNDKGGNVYILGYDSREELYARNELNELYEIDFEIKSAYYINHVDGLYVLEVTVIEYTGDIDDYIDAKKIDAICLLDSDVAITENNGDVEGICDDLGGELID